MRWRRREPETPDDHGRDRGAGQVPEFAHIRLLHCPVCGSLAAGRQVVHVIRTPGGIEARCRLRRGVDCAYRPVTLRRAEAVTGMDADTILTEIYASIGRPDDPMRAEAADRLGMAAPRPTGRACAKVVTGDAAAALDAVMEQAVPAVPVIDEPRLRAEFRGIQKAWSSRGLWSGPVDEAAGIIRANLERDVARRGFKDFTVEVLTEDHCVDLTCRYTGVAAYRTWRTPDRLHFCGGTQAILGYGTPHAHGGRAAMWHDHGLLPALTNDAALGKRARTRRLVDELFTIALTRGFLGTGGEPNTRAREIGAELDRIGGLRAMRTAHAALRADVDRSAARELDSAWDGIGGWLG